MVDDDDWREWTGAEQRRERTGPSAPAPWMRPLVIWLGAFLLVLSAAIVVCCIRIHTQTQQIYLLGQHLDTLRWLEQWFETQVMSVLRALEAGRAV